MKAALQLACLVLVLVFAGPLLDRYDEIKASADNQVQAIEQARQRARFERAAQALCAQEHGGWYEVSPGVIDCATKRGYRTQRSVQVSLGD